MAITYHLAELMLKIHGDLNARKANLLKAQEFYERFLKLLDSYDMLSRSDSRLFETYLENKTEFSTASTKDAAARRETKVARFREEKELKKKLEVGRLTYILVGCTDPRPVSPAKPQARGKRRTSRSRTASHKPYIHGPPNIPVA